MNAHPTGQYQKSQRLHAIMAEGGLSDCGNAQNCVQVCPKAIPLTTAIGELGRQVTLQLLKDMFGKSCYRCRVWSRLPPDCRQTKTDKRKLTLTACRI
jgi:hypothetical protein